MDVKRNDAGGNDELNDLNKLDLNKLDERSNRELVEFERKLRLAMRHRAAPAGMKTRVLALARERRNARRGWGWMMQRVAASAVLAAIVGGVAVYHQSEEKRKGEAAREQVLTAFRITNQTLDRVNQRLVENDR